MRTHDSRYEDRADVGHRSSTEIKHDIDRTLAEMDATVGQLQGRMSIRGIASELAGSLGGRDDVSGSRTSPGRVWDAAKANPGPAALLGLGIAWLMIDRFGRKGGDDYEIGRGRERDWLSPGAEYFPADFGEESPRRRGGEGRAEGGTRIGEKAEHLRERAVEGAESLKEKASDIVDSMKERVSGAGRSISSVRERASDRMSELKDQASDVSRKARERLHDVGDQVQMRSSQLKRQTEDLYEESPLAFGAAALAIGVGLGLVVPSTRRENELIGRRSDQFKEKAKGAGQTVLQQATQVAKDVAGAVKQNMAGDDDHPLADRATEAIGRVIDVAKDQVKQSVQGMSSQGGEASSPSSPGVSGRSPQSGGQPRGQQIGDDVNVD